MAISTFQTLTTPSIYHNRPDRHHTIKASSLSHSSSNIKKKLLDVGVGLLAAASMIVASPLDANATRIEYYATVAEPPCEMQFAPSGLGYCDVAVGFGQQAPYSTLINIHYTARFGDGIVFDSSYKRGRPLTMRIGVGKVIKGLDQGIFGGEGVPPMLVGGRRKLQIPPELAYGPEPAGCFSGDCNVPANATLLYDINFVNIYSAIRQLAYGNTPDAFDENLQMGEYAARDCLENFNKCIIDLYMSKYLRKPTLKDVKKIYEAHENIHGFPALVASCVVNGVGFENRLPHPKGEVPTLLPCLDILIYHLHVKDLYIGETLPNSFLECVLSQDLTAFCLRLFTAFCIRLFTAFCLRFFTAFCLRFFTAFCLRLFTAFCLRLFTAFKILHCVLSKTLHCVLPIYFQQYTQLAIPEFHDTLIQHMESVKKSIDERAQHKREYDSWVNERQMQTTEEKFDTSKALDASLVNIESSRTDSKEQDTSSRSGNDAHDDDADIRPIYDEEPMAEQRVFSVNHDSCLTKLLNEVNSRAKVPSNKTTNKNKLVEQISVPSKQERQIPTGHRWKPTGRIFKTVGLRWVPTGKIFTSSTTKVDSEPPNGSNSDITNKYECERTLDVSAGTQNGFKEFSIDEQAMTFDHNSLELGIHDHSNEPCSSKLVPKVVPSANTTATS
uniref:peptidylprolyl isomerase n=1 Tax=Tanacetum cinerariifolium TaxID=118510 RepID=A0A6L2L2Y7_TANCI|nr:photosynthetic NDH subunit of lumenal location 4, chloroplastic [Tanacetum cinerariifolium]